MPRPLRRAGFLHVALLALVAIGVLLQPVLGALGELHALEHAAAALDADHGHPHVDGHEEPARGGDGHGDPIGGHGLLHQAGVTTAMALLDASALVLAPSPVDDPPLRTHAPGPPGSQLTLPFRPPIA